MNDFCEHIRERGLRPWHKAWVDYDNELVTFPIFFGDKLAGSQKYNWKDLKKGRDNTGRYYTYVSDAYKQCICYGMDNCIGYGPIYIVEGIWDSIRLSNCWVDSLAVLCNDPHKQLRQWIKIYAAGRPIIAVCDRDSAGGRLASVGDCAWTVPEGYKDVNEMTDDECQEWLLSKEKQIK